MSGYPAQIVFTQTSTTTWVGRLLNTTSVVDVTDERSAEVTWSPIFNIEENKITGRCTATIQRGRLKNGRRYVKYLNVTAAQEAGIRWAARCFKLA